MATYINAPELLHGIKRDDLLQEIIPVVALVHISRPLARRECAAERTLPLAGLVNQRVHLLERGCLTLKCSLS